MTRPTPPGLLYLAARRVLLDALVALEPHLDAVIVIGAQAVYMRTQDRMLNYQPFTTDADLVINPGRLAADQLLGDAMRTSGFGASREPGIWIQTIEHPEFDDGIAIPVDLIVPAHIAPKAGRRGARLPGGHGNKAARKTRGVEGALVDHDLLLISALDDADSRRVAVNVAGAAALVVAKAHKLGERLRTPSRLIAKDAGDLYRLFEATPSTRMAATTKRLLADERSSRVPRQALTYLTELFGTPRSPGIELATGALSDVADAFTVTEMMVGCVRDLVNEVGANSRRSAACRSTRRHESCLR